MTLPAQIGRWNVFASRMCVMSGAKPAFERAARRGRRSLPSVVAAMTTASKPFCFTISAAAEVYASAR
jgi:hypothetical protein